MRTTAGLGSLFEDGLAVPGRVLPVSGRYLAVPGRVRPVSGRYLAVLGRDLPLNDRYD